MFIWTFLITKTWEITSCSYALKSWNTLYIYIYMYRDRMYDCKTIRNIFSFSSKYFYNLEYSWTCVPPTSWEPQDFGRYSERAVGVAVRKIDVRNPAEARDFSLLLNARTGSTTQWLSGVLSSELKWAVCEPGQWPPSSGKIKNMWS